MLFQGCVKEGLLKTCVKDGVVCVGEAVEEMCEEDAFVKCGCC
jgi:hypothetical protein